MSHAIADGLLKRPTFWRPPPTRAVLSWPLPHQGIFDRTLIRAISLVASRQVLEIRGLDQITPTSDPFILALNHSTRSESILVPALLFLHRGGKLIHFLADWNYRLVPGIGLLYRRAQTITVTRKSARPPIFNVFKPLYMSSESALDRARAHLVAGRSIGIFPEGAVNRDPFRLQHGYTGAARLSLETGAPVIPAGIRFPQLELDEPISDFACMEILIGAPLYPSQPPTFPAPLAQVQAWHSTMMNAISHLSGKTWNRPAQGNSDDQEHDCASRKGPYESSPRHRSPAGNLRSREAVGHRS